MKTVLNLEKKCRHILLEVSTPEDSSKDKLESEMKFRHILLKISTHMDSELSKVKVLTHDTEIVDTCRQCSKQYQVSTSEYSVQITGNVDTWYKKY